MVKASKNIKMGPCTQESFEKVKKMDMENLNMLMEPTMKVTLIITQSMEKGPMLANFISTKENGKMVRCMALAAVSGSILKGRRFQHILANIAMEKNRALVNIRIAREEDTKPNGFPGNFMINGLSQLRTSP